ncbi:MAG: hypothetical protein M3X11_22935 [Acidobacteriota bacterium]|nr:hypothetical protein [Acidobacteriota bacterium]
MNKRFIVIGLCLAMLFSTLPAMGQTTAPANQSWDVLRQLPGVQTLQAERRDGKKSNGQIVSCSDTELVIERKGKLETFNRNDVKKVWTVAPANRTQKAIFGGIGLLGGVMAGAAIAVSLGFKQCGGSCVDEGAGALAAVIGLPAAGVIGGRALARGKRTLIYSTP